MLPYHEQVRQLKPLDIKLGNGFIPGFFGDIWVLTHPETPIAWRTGSFSEPYLLDHKHLVEDVIHYFEMIDKQSYTDENVTIKESMTIHVNIGEPYYAVALDCPTNLSSPLYGSYVHLLIYHPIDDIVVRTINRQEIQW